jgi:hypothetical protein
MLRDGCQALVEEELEAVVVGADAEMPATQVWPPMANILYEANEFPRMPQGKHVEGPLAYCRMPGVSCLAATWLQTRRRRRRTRR